MYMNLYLTACINDGAVADRNNSEDPGRNIQTIFTRMTSNNPPQRGEPQNDNQPSQEDTDEITGTPTLIPERGTGLSSVLSKFSLR